MRHRSAPSAADTATATVPLCDACKTPWDYQVADAEKLLAQQCGGDFQIVEEGVRASGTTTGVPVGGIIVAQQGRDYYWIARCGTAP